MIGDADGVAAGYAACVAETRRRARNFWLGIRLLPPERRRALAAVYWFSHRADEAVDGKGSPGEPGLRLDRVREDLERALSGSPSAPPWAALADASARFRIPAGLYRRLLDGVARDVAPARYDDWPALREYCYDVASVVGLVALRVFGGRGSEAEGAAEELGYALQLTNILRDLREDAANGRWYLPLDECARFGVTAGAVAAGRAEPGFDALVLATAERARAYYGAGPRLARRLPRATRLCPAALAGVYRALLERIARSPRSVLDGRVELSPGARIARGLGAGVASLAA